MLIHAILQDVAPNQRPVERHGSGPLTISKPMTTCFLAWALALLLLSVLVLLATEGRHTRIRRWRRQGHTWQAIADPFGVSISTVRRWSQV